MTTLQLSAPPRRTTARTATAERAPGRTLRGYLLLPRPKDLVKAIILPLTFLLGAAATGDLTGQRLWRAALVWCLLELCVYQARYQWNDVRGFAADQAHPEGAARGRLPGPIERARPHITASLAVAAVRLAITALAALLLPDLRATLIAMTIGVFGVAVVYEHLRTRATGNSSDVPIPLRPSLVALWVAVGMGYAVRGMTGLALAVDLGGRTSLVVVATVSMWALGIVFVTCRWALEAMCFATFRGSRVTWGGQPKAREHTLGLVRWLPDEVETQDVPASAEPAHWRALRRPTSLGAPWNLALLAAGAGSAATGALLVDGPDAAVLAVVAVVGAALTLALALLPARRLLAAFVSTGLLAGLQGAFGVHRPIAAALPWLVVGIAYFCFTRQCADEIGHPLRRVALLLRG